MGKSIKTVYVVDSSSQARLALNLNFIIVALILAKFIMLIIDSHSDVSLRIFSNRMFSVCSSCTHTKLEPPLFCLIMFRKYDSIFFSRKKLQMRKV